jgi:trigger factor
MALSTSEVIPETSPTATEAEHTHDHSHEGHDHSHDHSHDGLEAGLHPAHSHGPALNPEVTREIEVEAPVDEVDKAFKRAIKGYQKHARFPGFRAGKAPDTLVRSRFAKEIRQEVLESLVSEKFRAAIESQKLKPISQPQIVEMLLNEGAPLKFKAAFEVLPEFDVAGYDSIKVEKPDTALTEDEYEGELARILDQHSAVEPVDEDRALAEGDWAEIEFSGEIKELAQTVGEEGLESKQTNAPIHGDDVLIEIGGRNTLKAFTDALVGKKPGDEMAFDVEYPADFGEQRLAGKAVAYDVKIKSIKKKIKPELNAEFAKQLGDYESYEDFTAKLREHLASGKKSRLENIAQEKLVEELVAKFNFPVPESLVQQQVDARLDRGLRALAQQGMAAEQMRKLDFPRLRAAQRDAAVNEVKASLILDKIADAEKIEVPDADLERELLMLSIQHREPLEELQQRLAKDGSLDRIREQLRREKTGSTLYARLAG